MANTATFRIHSVKCRDEMGGSTRERFGNDEIQCAVFSADLRGSIKNSGRIDIYDNFDDGDVKRFSPPKEVVTLDLAGATDAVALGFSVLLIESQLREGGALNSAFEAFGKLYEESLKEQLKGLMLPEDARRVAQPNYLAPSAELSPTLHGLVRAHRARVNSANSIGSTAAASVAASAAVATVTDVGNDTPPTKKEEKDFTEQVGDAFLVALATAIALFTVEGARWVVSALARWSQDKFFAPVPINVKVDASVPPETVPPNASGVAEFRGHDGIYEMEWDILVR